MIRTKWPEKVFWLGLVLMLAQVAVFQFAGPAVALGTMLTGFILASAALILLNSRTSRFEVVHNSSSGPDVG